MIAGDHPGLMSGRATLTIDALSTLVTGRTSELFLPDVESHYGELKDRLDGNRILVIGGAGSIGGATVRALLAFGPAALHVVDHNENNLVELVRDLRSGPTGIGVKDFRALPIDFGSPVMQRFLREEPPYGLVLNFAALKHVRSEKDVYSLLTMLETNIVKPVRLMRWLNEKGAPYRYFCVSTDKAANPVNLMGASKRIMEHAVFSEEVAPNPKAYVTSARFPNVAFSEGSLLDGFLKRLQKHQPLALPRGARRYFITLREAGQICLLASVCVPHRHLLIPRMDSTRDSYDLQSIAIAVLRAHGLEPRVFQNDREARTSVASGLGTGHYPLVLTELDTTGEKPHEEFLGDGEKSVEVGMTRLLGVPHHPAPRGAVSGAIEKIDELIARQDRRVSKQDIVALISTAVPNFTHAETGKNLDEQA